MEIERLKKILADELGMCQVIYGKYSKGDAAMSLLVSQWAELFRRDCDYPEAETHIRQAFFCHKISARTFPLPCEVREYFSRLRKTTQRASQELAVARDSIAQQRGSGAGTGRIFYLAYKGDGKARQKVEELKTSENN